MLFATVFPLSGANRFQIIANNWRYFDVLFRVRFAMLTSALVAYGLTWTALAGASGG